MVAEALEQHPDVMFVGVAALDTDDAMEDFVATYGLQDMITIVDDDGSIWSRYGVRAQPAWVFVDATGEMDTHFGALARDELDRRLRDLAGG